MIYTDDIDSAVSVVVEDVLSAFKTLKQFRISAVFKLDCFNYFAFNQTLFDCVFDRQRKVFTAGPHGGTNRFRHSLQHGVISNADPAFKRERCFLQLSTHAPIVKVQVLIDF